MNPAALVFLTLGGGYVVYKAARGEPILGGGQSAASDAPADYSGLMPGTVVDPFTGLVPGAAAATDPYAPDVTGTAENALSAVDQAYLAIAEKQAALQDELARAADGRAAAVAQAELDAINESAAMMREQAGNGVAPAISDAEQKYYDTASKANEAAARASDRSTKDAVISGIAMGAPYAAIPAAAGLVKLGAKLRKGGIGAAKATANVADDAAKLVAKAPKLGPALPTGVRGVAVRTSRAIASPAAKVATVAAGAYTSARNVVDIGQSIRAATQGNTAKAQAEASSAMKRGVQFLSLGTTNMNVDKGTFKVAGVHVKPIENMAKGKFNPLKKSFWK